MMRRLLICASVVVGLVGTAWGQSFEQMSNQTNMMLQQYQMMTEARMMNLQQQREQMGRRR